MSAFLKGVTFLNFISLIMVCANFQGYLFPKKVKDKFPGICYATSPTGKFSKEPFVIAIGDINEIALFFVFV